MNQAKLCTQTWQIPETASERDARASSLVVDSVPCFHPLLTSKRFLIFLNDSFLHDIPSGFHTHTQLKTRAKCNKCTFSHLFTLHHGKKRIGLWSVNPWMAWSNQFDDLFFDPVVKLQLFRLTRNCRKILYLGNLQLRRPKRFHTHA